MDIEFDWNNIPNSEEIKNRIEGNIRNEIENSFPESNTTSSHKIATLHYNHKSNSIYGSVHNEKNSIEMTFEYSLNQNCAAIYTPHN